MNLNDLRNIYSPNANKAIELAFEGGRRYGSQYIGSEHILYGLLMSNCVAQSILKSEGVDQERYKTLFAKSIDKNSTLKNFTPRTKNILSKAYEFSLNAHSGFIGTEHLLLAILVDSETIAVDILKSMRINIKNLISTLEQTIYDQIDDEFLDEEAEINSTPKNSIKTQNKSAELINLEKFGIDLTEKARNGKLDPVIGRKKEIDRIIQILTRRTKNNPVLIGEPGVGKSAVIEGLAQAIINRNVPEILIGKTVFSLDMASVLAGSRYRGEFEEKLKAVVDNVKKDGDILLFIDEIHNIVGAGSTGDGNMDAANILKPLLSRGEMQTIGATTIDEYRKYIEKDPALERRFQPVVVEAPSVEETIEILKGLRDKYEAHHKVVIADDAINAAVMLSDRYITERFLPDKAIDLIDETASRARLDSYNFPEVARLKDKEIAKITAEKFEAVKREDLDRAFRLSKKLEETQNELNEIKRKQADYRMKTNVEIHANDVAKIVSQSTGIPTSKLTETETEKLLNLEEELNKKVIGQKEAVSIVSKAIRRARAGLKDANRPIGSFIFVGSTGVGKTELSKALAECLFNDGNSLIRVDMSEYMEKSSVAKLIGAPPGYVGFDEAGQLTEKVRRKPYSVILFDEIEKAHPDIFNLLLQILDEGRLTDNKGRLINFRNCILIMTSNVGSKEVKTFSLGFYNNGTDVITAEYEKMSERIRLALKEEFNPEFLNRIDDIVVFHKLTKTDAKDIVDILIKGLEKRLLILGVKLIINEKALDLIVEKGYDDSYGARPLKRTIQKMVEDRLSEEIIKGNILEGETVIVGEQNGELTFCSK